MPFWHLLYVPLRVHACVHVSISPPPSLPHSLTHSLTPHSLTSSPTPSLSLCLFLSPSLSPSLPPLIPRARCVKDDVHGTHKTHLGRATAATCMMIGPMLVSLMTATFSRNMALNTREIRLLKTLDKDRLEARCVCIRLRLISVTRRFPLPNWGIMKHVLFRKDPCWTQGVEFNLRHFTTIWCCGKLQCVTLTSRRWVRV
jgi:hypothetical protein